MQRCTIAGTMVSSLVMATACSRGIPNTPSVERRGGSGGVVDSIHILHKRVRLRW